MDAVYIPLPNHLHAEWTIAAARAGKHVLCEKPLTLTAADAERVVETCEREGVRLMEAFMYRLHPSWTAVREIVASGRIGRLRTVQSWFSYYNDDPANIRNQMDAGGGALWDIGCYTVNLSRMLFDAEPDTVQASLVRDPATGVDVADERDPRVRRRPGLVHRVHQGRERPARPHRTAPTAGSRSASRSTSHPTARPRCS